MKTPEERIAVLEEQNRVAGPIHERFQENLDNLNVQVARIETKVDRILENGSQKAWRERIGTIGAPAVGGGGLIAVLLLVLERL